MKGFDVLKISEETSVGELLLEARIRRRIDIHKAANDLKIKQVYLQAIERDDWDILPQGVYVKTFIREYSLYLGVDPQESLSRFQITHRKENNKEKSDRLFSHQKIARTKLLVFPRIVRLFLITLVVLAAFSYFAFYLHNYRAAPILEIIDPADNIIVDSNFINVIGFTDPGAEVSINNEQVLPDAKGSFSLRVNLKNGINLIRIISSKNKGNKTIVERRVLLK